MESVDGNDWEEPMKHSIAHNQNPGNWNPGKRKINEDLNLHRVRGADCKDTSGWTGEGLGEPVGRRGE